MFSKGICLGFCLCRFLSLSLSVCLSVCLSLPPFLLLCLSLYLSVCLSLRPSLPPWLSVSVSVCLSLSVCLSVSVSVCLSVSCFWTSWFVAITSHFQIGTNGLVSIGNNYAWPELPDLRKVICVYCAYIDNTDSVGGQTNQPYIILTAYKWVIIKLCCRFGCADRTAYMLFDFGILCGPFWLKMNGRVLWAVLALLNFAESAIRGT